MNTQPLSGSRQDIIGPRSDLNETNIVNLDRRGRPTKNNNLIFTKKTKPKTVNKTRKNVRFSDDDDTDSNSKPQNQSQAQTQNQTQNQNQAQNQVQVKSQTQTQTQNQNQNQPQTQNQAQNQNQNQGQNQTLQKIIEDVYQHADALGKVADLPTPPSSQPKSTIQNASPNVSNLANLNPTQQASIMKAIQTLIPTELSIIINTSIPGFQIINYNPSYSFPKIKTDNKVYFDPLVKLKQDIIDEVPKEIRREQFCIKGYFESLKNYHGLRKNMTLLQATEEGFVDDNIQTTLENLFPVGGHFYVGGQTYSIVDALWTKGSWKIDKQLMDIGQLNNIKTKNPLLFNSILTNLINNNNEINELPATVRYGSNYTPPQKAQTTGATAGAIQPTPQQTQEIQQIQQFQQQLIQQGQIPQANPVPPNLQIGYQPQFNLPIQRNPLPQYPMSQNLQIGYQQPQPILTAQQIQQLLNSGVSEQMIIDCLSGNVPINQLIQSNNVNKNKQLLIENDPQLVEESTALALLGQENLHPSRQSTNNVRDYFGHYTTNNNKTSGRRWINNENYYFLCNQVFRRLEPVNQNLIQRFYNNTTKTNLVFGADNISKDAYSDSVRGIGVITSSSDGNCFFQAVSQGINHYNMTSNQRIIYGIYGATQQFTQSALRNIVAEYLINIFRKASQEQIERIYMGPFNSINELNEMFANQAELYFGRPAVEADFIRMPDRDYIQLCNTVYQNYFSNGGSTFLIKQVTSKPINNRMNPFNFFQANEEQSIIKYINSANYWGDELSIKAIRETLGLNIFIISNRYNANNPRGLEIYRAPEVIPQIYETPQEPRENSDIFDKYMFLYNEANAHYELVTFTYYNKQKNQMQVSIFETNMNIMPALHIIFFLYVHTYLNLTVQQKDGCIFMQQIFHIIDVAVQAIGREFNNETLQNIQNSPPDPNNMMPGKGLNYMGQPETPNCKFMRLIMNLFRPNGDVIYQNPPNMYTQYFLNTWRQYIGQYRYTIWSYPDDNVTYRYIDPNARDGYVKLVPDHNMTQGPPGLDTRARNQLIQKGGQFGQYGQYRQNNYMNPSTGYMNPSTGYMNPSTGYMNPNDQYYQALINLNNAQNLQYLTNDQVKVIMSNFSNLKKTNISYQITIDLELEKGDKLTAISYAAAKCRNKWNKIRKNYSEITGLKYTIPPVYSNLVNNPLTTYSKSGKGYKKEKDKDKDKEKDKEKDDK